MASKAQKDSYRADVGSLFVGWVFVSTAQSTATSQRSLLRDELVQSCERVNVLRREVNTTSLALQEFMQLAIDARTRSAELGTGEAAANDLRAAQEYQKLLDTIELVDIPDCEEVVDELSFNG